MKAYSTNSKNIKIFNKRMQDIVSQIVLQRPQMYPKIEIIHDCGGVLKIKWNTYPSFTDKLYMNDLWKSMGGFITKHNTGNERATVKCFSIEEALNYKFEARNQSNSVSMLFKNIRKFLRI